MSGSGPRRRAARVLAVIFGIALAVPFLPAGLASAAPATTATVGDAASASAPTGRVNDFTCRPDPRHPDPVVLLHGLGATSYEDLNVLQGWLATRGYCTFSRTYGAYPQFPLVGGIRDIDESGGEIATFVREVRTRTGASAVDLVGHSEGGFQALYVPKTQDVAGSIGHVVAIAPPTHGTTFAGLVRIADGLNARPEVDTALRTAGCVACTQLTAGGDAVSTLNAGAITRPGVDYSVITSRYDELVTPPETAFVREPGVDNRYVQDVCPADPVGHIGEAYDTNVWNLVANAIEDAPGRRFPCGIGSPG